MESRQPEPKATYFPDSKYAIVEPGSLECEVHFPLPITLESFNFFPVNVELKPKKVGP